MEICLCGPFSVSVKFYLSAKVIGKIRIRTFMTRMCVATKKSHKANAIPFFGLSMLIFRASLVTFIETREIVQLYESWPSHLIRLLEFCHARSPFTGRLSPALALRCRPTNSNSSEPYPYNILICTHVAHINIENAS